MAEGVAEYYKQLVKLQLPAETIATLLQNFQAQYFASQVMRDMMPKPWDSD